MCRPIGYTLVLDGREFTRRAKRYAKRAGLDFRFLARKGKGSHSKVFVGGRDTIVKRTEIGKGLLDSMLKDLGIPKEDF
ncbi:MAG: hypothetical protein OXN96_08935 [Bryobacterales bacterium]|nr:hypothetical protein [Bryobacterales bacterium]